MPELYTAAMQRGFAVLSQPAGAYIYGLEDGENDPPQRMPPLGTPLADLKITFNTVGVAGLFGGEEAISAMATVHLFKGRRWLGWYNSPASYGVAKRFGRLGNSRFWQGVFPGSRDSLAVSLGLDGKQGPRYIGALSGTMIMPTPYISYLAMKRSREVEAEQTGRVTTPFDVTYLTIRPVSHAVPIPLPLGRRAFYALFTIFSSVVTCVMCALVYDWFSFSTILIGIICGGLATSVIGEGKLDIRTVKRPAPGAPPGHGILIEEGGVVVIKGEEQDVSIITKGRFELKTDSKPVDEEKGGNQPHYHAIGLCCLVLFLQSLLQLLLISQGTFFGQIMFVISVSVSWGYNSYLSSLDKEKLQTDILFEALGNPQMLRFRVGTRTMMIVFVCLLLFHGVECSSPEDARRLRCKMLNECLSNDTAVWKRWKDKVVEQLVDVHDGSDSLLHLEDLDNGTLSESEKELLDVLLKDARAAFEEYFNVRGELPDDSSHRKKVE